MTKEAFEEGRKIIDAIERLKRSYDQIRPYLGEPTELTIRVKNNKKIHKVDTMFILVTDSPLFLAIGSALEDMITELENQLSKLDSNIEKPLEPADPIERTSFWSKVWKR